ncbi:MAG: hypothetical protein HY430_01755 [Candidatus Levybacteria bacterium]|nr:hypothetical protein [Candidatus Levybacteria bacterium]
MGGTEYLAEIKTAQSEIQLGKKLVNRCKNSFDNSQLKLAGGQFSGYIAKSPQFMPHLRNAELPDMDTIERGSFNVRLPKVYEGMLFVGDRTLLEESYVDAVGGKDHHNLPQIGVQLAAEGGVTSGTVVRTVFGGTEEMPLRGISYLLPPLIYLEQLKEKGIVPPQLQIIFANNISVTLNHLDHERATDQAVQFANFAHEYIREYFPQVSESAVFLEDTLIEKGSVIRDELIDVYRTLKTELSPETRDALLGKGNNGSSRLNPFYGAAHLLVHDTSIPGMLVPLVEDQPDVVTPQAIISFGGYQEGIFYDVRQEIKPHLREEYRSLPTLQYFTKHRVPPYYMARGGDYSLDATLQGVRYDGGKVAKTAQYDLGYLHEVTRTRGTIDFADFVAQHGERMAA